MGPASARAPPPQRCATPRLLSVLLPAAEPQQWPPSSCARPAARRPRRRPAPARRWAGLPPSRRRHLLRPLAEPAVAPPRVGQPRRRPGAAFPGWGPAGGRGSAQSRPRGGPVRANPGAVGRGRAGKGVSCHPWLPQGETEALRVPRPPSPSWPRSRPRRRRSWIRTRGSDRELGSALTPRDATLLATKQRSVQEGNLGCKIKHKFGRKQPHRITANSPRDTFRTSLLMLLVFFLGGGGSCYC